MGGGGHQRHAVQAGDTGHRAAQPDQIGAGGGNVRTHAGADLDLGLQHLVRHLFA